MASPDGRAYIVFNGAIYNYRELRHQLVSHGCTFHSQSDTEVLLQAYVHFGPQVLARLVGMFAFAILDIHTQTVFLARDAFGIKPLYYTWWRDGFAFASEIKPLLGLPGVHRQVHPQRLYRYLRFGVTDDGDQTLFAGIYQLPAAHYLQLPLDTPGHAQPRRYWSVPLEQTSELSFDQAAEALRALFLENIRLHLRSDVPVGAALSGGIDSSSIVAAMRQIEGADLTLETFSYVASSTALSEEPWAEMAAHRASARIHKTRPTPQDLVVDLPRLIDIQGEPFGSTSIYAQMRVFRLARDTGIKVMLDGQGADELLGGYRPHVAAWLASLLRQRRWREALRLWRSVPQSPGLSHRMLLERAVGLLGTAQVASGLSGHLLRRYLFPPWLRGSWFEAHGVVAAPLWQAHGTLLLRDHLYQALTDQSLPMLLRYEDRNSMAFGIESRVPFLTPQLVSFIFTLPEAYLIATDGTSKSVLRRAMRGLVPDAILDRRDKIGFATPEREWLDALRPWVEDMLNSDTAKRIPALDLPAVQREWRQVMAGQKPFDNRCWRWLNVISWAAHFEVDCEP
jgi:asparagine synthase (glutamine-hydrolysing)